MKGCVWGRGAGKATSLRLSEIGDVFLSLGGSIVVQVKGDALISMVTRGPEAR